MAREGKVIVKILKDVCSPIPYMGHSHERSLVHLLNPCSDVNRKDIQCNTFSFDYYEEGDNIVFKVKDNATIIGYNVSKEFTVVYWSSQDNNFVHTQGDGNGGNFNRSNFFVQEGDYYVGKVNRDWFLKAFDLKEIAIRVAYFDLDNHEEELIYCYSEIRKSSSFTPKKKLVKCSPGLKVDEQLFAATYNYHLTMSLNDHYTMFRPGEEVKYYLRYAIDDVDQGEELVYTHTTGGLVPDKEKDISVIASAKKVYFKFRIEYPPGYDVGYPDPNQTECYAEQTKITPKGNSKPFVKCSPFITIKNKQHQPTGWSFDVVLQPRATVPANTTTKYFFDYTVNDVWQGEELVQTNTIGGELPDFTKSIFTTQESGFVKVKFKIELPPEVSTGGDRTCYFEIPVELKGSNLPDVMCANPHLTVNSDNTARFVCALVENKQGNYTKEPTLYWSDDEATYTLDANSSLFIEESPNVYKFNLSSPIHKFYKAILTVKENGVVKHTCEAVARSNNKPTIHCNPIMTYEKEPNGSNGIVYKLKLNPNDNFTNFIAGKDIYYFVKSYFDDVSQGESIVYIHNTGGILPIKESYIYVNNKIVKKVKIEFRIEYPSDYYEVDKRVCDYTIEDDDVWGQGIEDTFNCDRATMSGSPFNCDQTYDTGLSNFADIIKNNYEVTPKVYYSPDGGTNWEVYEEGSQSLSGGEDTDYVYRGCIQKKFGISRYKFGVELKNKKTGVISDKKCYVEFMLEDTVQEQSHCYSITVSEREANEEVKYKGDIYINMYRGYDVLPSYKIKTYYRYYDETNYKELSETTIDMTTYVDNTVAYTAFVKNPRDKYYLKAELIRTDFDYVICETEENLIRKE